MELGIWRCLQSGTKLVSGLHFLANREINSEFAILGHVLSPVPWAYRAEIIALVGILRIASKK